MGLAFVRLAGLSMLTSPRPRLGALLVAVPSLTNNDQFPVFGNGEIQG
jgi:hypothetical protein